MRKIKHFCFIVLLFSIFILTKRTEAAVQDANDSTLAVQWQDENFGASICKALKKEEVTYADIEGIIGISIDSQYTVKLDWEDTTEEYVYNAGNDMCVILELQEFSTLEDLKKFPDLRALRLNECIVDDNIVLGKMTNLTCCGKTEQKKLAKLAPTGSLNMTSIPLKVKQKTTALKVSGLASGDYIKAYTSSNKKIFTVTKKGQITAIKAGNAVLTVTLASGKQLKAKIKVQKGTVKTSKVTVAERSKVLKKGKLYQIKALISPLTSQEKVTYSTSNKKVATVSKTGKVVAKKKGKVVITVKSGKKNAKVTITVK